MANEIVVNPVELRRYASEIGKCNTAYHTSMANAQNQVNSLKNVWTGDASVAFNASFAQLQKKCFEGLDTLAKMINALYESADAYEKNEKAVQNEGSKMQKLPSNTMR